MRKQERREHIEQELKAIEQDIDNFVDSIKQRLQKIRDIAWNRESKKRKLINV